MYLNRRVFVMDVHILSEDALKYGVVICFLDLSRILFLEIVKVTRFAVTLNLY